jgi:hypothetical protein
VVVHVRLAGGVRFGRPMVAYVTDGVRLRQMRAASTWMCGGGAGGRSSYVPGP